MQATNNGLKKIAEIAKSEFQTKSYRRPIVEILADLRNPVPARFIKKKPIFKRLNGKLEKAGEVDYIPWTAYCRLLDYFCPGWNWEIRTQYLGDRTVVEGKLTLHAEEGNFTREATGQEESDVDGYGDPSSNAEAMAFRRCCAKFGLALNLWEK